MGCKLAVSPGPANVGQTVTGSLSIYDRIVDKASCQIESQRGIASGKHCCVPGCKSDSRYQTIDQSVWFHCIPTDKASLVSLHTYRQRGAYLCSPVPMFPGTHVPRYLCSPVPMFPEPMFPGTYAPRYLCSPNLCSPVPMFLGTYVPRFAVNDSSTPPRLIVCLCKLCYDCSNFCSGS